MNTLHWVIRGYNSTEKIYEKTVKAGVFGTSRCRFFTDFGGQNFVLMKLLVSVLRTRPNRTTICCRSTKKVPTLFINVIGSFLAPSRL